MPAARPDLRHPLTVRLTTTQDTHIRALAAERGVRPSDAMRSLVDAGIVLEQASRLGLVLTPSARALVSDGHMSHLAFALALTPEQVEALHLAEHHREQLRQGAVLLGTREELLDVEAEVDA